MPLMPLVQGLTQVGRYALSQKQQERETKNRFTLEMLRNEMWKRRLREQAVQQERQRQMLIEREKERTKQALMEQQRMYAEHQDEMAYKDKLLKIKDRELGIDEKKAQADLIKQGKEADPRIKQLETLIRLRQAYSGKYYPQEKLEEGALMPTKKYEPLGRQPRQMQYIDKLIQELSSDIYGLEYEPVAGREEWRKRAGMGRAIGKAYQQIGRTESVMKPKTDSWRDYLE